MSRTLNSLVAAAVVIANCLLVLAVVNGAIMKKQAIVDSGRTIFLELAPVDPRSLMQGDYMALAYAVSRDKAVLEAPGSMETRGRMVMTLDEQGIAKFARFEKGETELGEDEMLLNYRKWRRGYRFGIESFFFQEGMAENYARAKYAELRVSEEGTPVLVDLRGEDLKTLPLQEDGRDGAE